MTAPSFLPLIATLRNLPSKHCVDAIPSSSSGHPTTLLRSIAMHPRSLQPDLPPNAMPFGHAQILQTRLRIPPGRMDAGVGWRRGPSVMIRRGPTESASERMMHRGGGGEEAPADDAACDGHGRVSSTGGAGWISRLFVFHFHCQFGSEFGHHLSVFFFVHRSGALFVRWLRRWRMLWVLGFRLGLSTATVTAAIAIVVAILLLLLKESLGSRRSDELLEEWILEHHIPLGVDSGSGPQCRQTSHGDFSQGDGTAVQGWMSVAVAFGGGGVVGSGGESSEEVEAVGVGGVVVVVFVDEGRVFYFFVFVFFVGRCRRRRQTDGNTQHDFVGDIFDGRNANGFRQSRH
mmetsp:Transcript_25254/g.50627  ORF Transcript_25254/g.50627 Transcript_25254/m.50627 type:complete len:346 (-) Transcript_25254:684-1721(-)